MDAYATEFDAQVAEVDREGGRVRLDRTAFYPGGGGQPYDLGTIQTAAGTLSVTSVRREAGAIWHVVEAATTTSPRAPRCTASSTGPAATS